MSPPAGTEILELEQCWTLLETNSVGRLAVDNGGRPDIFPINYIVDDGSIVFRTGAGTKLAAAALMHHVAFEIDGYEAAEQIAWSVVVKGHADQIERMHERYAVEELPLFPWVVSEKPNFVRIRTDEISGRRFHVVTNETGTD